MKTFIPSKEQILQFQNDGYLFVPDLFSPEEVELLYKIGKSDREKAATIWNPQDASGKESKLWLSCDTVNPTIYNAIARSRRVAGTMSRLLNDDVWLYHYKMMVKEPKVGGAWEWHQDYGYWYLDGWMYPDMASCFIAVDRSHKGNGCLQVLKGSHLLGRIEHGKFGGQYGADPERFEAARQKFELIHCEMQPGTALFFHSNLFHGSSPNTSDDPRWTFICCYNAARNFNFKSHDPVPVLEQWDDTRVMEMGQQQWNQMSSTLSSS